jgi:hypothetical protein
LEQGIFGRLFFSLVWKKGVEALRAIPYLTLWSIWLARNSIMFEGKFVPAFKVFAQVLGLLPFYKSITGTKPPRAIGELNVDKTLPWIFFDGLVMMPSMAVE